MKNKGHSTGTISSVISKSTSMEFLIFCYGSRAAAVPVIRWITKITWSAVEQSRAAKQSSGHKRSRPGAVDRWWYTIFECQVLLQKHVCVQLDWFSIVIANIVILVSYWASYLGILQLALQERFWNVKWALSSKDNFSSICWAYVSEWGVQIFWGRNSYVWKLAYH